MKHSPQSLFSLTLLCAALGLASACQREQVKATTTAAKTTTTSNSPCELVRIPHQGNAPLDDEIRLLQGKLGQDKFANERLEQLGWRFVEKARLSFDPGFYKLAEQCAQCLATQAKADDKPAKHAALLLRGHVLHNLHRFAEAEANARELVAARGLAFDHGLLGDVLLEQGKLAEAAQAYQQMMKLKPGPQAYLRAAQINWLRGELATAQELTIMAAQATGSGDQETTAWAWSKLAFYELQQGHAKQARQLCAAALKMLPDYAPALLLEGRSWLAENQPTKALAALQRAAERNPLPEYLWTLAEAYRANQQPQQAEECEAKLTTRGRADDPRTLALFLATRGTDAATAVQLAEAELRERQDVFTYDALAWAQAAAGQPQQAWQSMQKALASGTNDGRLLLHAALIAQQAGHAKLAQRYAVRARQWRATLLPSEQVQLKQIAL